MKKIIAIVLAAVTVLCLAACGKKTDNGNNADETTTADSRYVTSTVSRSFFDGKTEDDISAFCEQVGFESYVVNEDGSVTFTTTPEIRDVYTKILAMNVETKIQSYVEGGESQKTGVLKATRNSDFTEVIYTVDKETVAESDIFNIYSVVFSDCFYYNELCGRDKSKFTVTVDFIDEKTGESMLQDAE